MNPIIVPDEVDTEINALIGKIKNIETDRFLLGATDDVDKENIFKLLSDEDVVKNLNLKIHKTMADTENLLKDYYNGIKDNTKCPYTIIDKKTNNFVGVFLIKLDLYNENAYEFTIYLSKDFWGQGIYTEVLPYMVKVAFEELKTKNFRGYAMKRNIASIKVLEKSNLKLEKIFKVEGLDDLIYSYLITEEMYRKI